MSGDHIRLVDTPTDGVDHNHEQSPVQQRTTWWLVGFLIIQSLILFINSGATRYELNENAKLIKQLQERIIVTDLAKLRKGMTP